MAELFHSGRIIDVIILLVMLETAALLAYRRITGRGPRPQALLPTLASGLLLILALRAAIADLRWEFIALPLTLALVTHLLDIAQRWRGQ
ncbi:hypothetical protein CCR96_00635 [Halochromatium roseum]|nr:hypothetical protein [Halochromatium roseum]